jgi:hydrogenase maturation protease
VADRDAPALLIGYGNPLRRDDGVAWRVAAAVKDRFPVHHLLVVTTHQLTPELAEIMARSRHVLMVDAAVDLPPGDLALRSVRPAHDPRPTSTHHLQPETLLALAHTLSPNAPAHLTLLTIGGEDFQHGEALSPAVEAAVPVAVTLVTDWLGV